MRSQLLIAIPFVIPSCGALSTESQLTQALYSLYPNPAADYLMLNGDLTKVKGISILTADGSVKRPPRPYADQISVKDLAPGLYFLGIHGQNGISFIRFIKE